MNEKARRIKLLVEESGKSYQELETITGVKKSSLQRYASGITTKIPMDVIEKLETAFNVPRGYIMGWVEKPSEELQGMGAMAAELLMEPTTVEMLQDYRSLSAGDQATVRALVAALAAKSKKD